MEASTSTPGNDPFADSAPGVTENDPFADPPATEGDLAAEVAATPAEEAPPVVNREGQEVEPPAPAEGPDPAAAQPPVESAADTGALSAPADHMAPEAPAVPEEAPQPPQEPQSAPEAAIEPPAPAEAAPTPQETPEEGAAREAHEAAQAAALAEAEANGTVEQIPPAAAAPAEGDAAAPAPPTRTKGEMRHYKAFYQTAKNAWSEYPLEGELPEGVVVVQLDGEAFFEARNNDHATRIAFALLGQPQDGVTVWPVPKGAYKPKRVKPAAPRPERTRLEIS